MTLRANPMGKFRDLIRRQSLEASDRQVQPLSQDCPWFALAMTTDEPIDLVGIGRSEWLPSPLSQNTW